MAHEILEDDGIVYVGEVPWHGLGKQVDPNITAHEAMMQAGLNWRVRKQLLYYSPCNLDTNLVSVRGHVGIVRVDTGGILGVSTDRYEPFQNEEGFDRFESVLATGMAKIETAGSLRNGKIVWALARIQSEDMAVNGVDLIRPYVMLSFGHDAKRGVRLGFVPIRVVCNNTLSAAESNGKSRLVRVAHKGNVGGNVQLLIDALDLTVQEFRASVQDYRKMLNTGINAGDLREYVRVTLGLVESAENKRATNIIDKVAGYASAGIGNAPYAGTVYAGYNAITQWLTHDAGRNNDTRLSSLWFGSNKQTLRTAHGNAMQLVA